MKKTVFISSTYVDLASHRRAVWQLLEDFDISVRGMEQFGARTEEPLQTCLAELEQSDVYVGIIGFRVGSVEPSSGKSYTQLEYEQAARLGKEILIYMADEQNATVRYGDIDVDPALREKLKAFKDALRERHTVDTFTNEDDLTEKLRTNLARYVQQRKPEPEEPKKDEFEGTLRMVRRFLLLPKSVSGREVRFRVSFFSNPYPASRDICRAFNLDYGLTIGTHITIDEPRLANQERFPFRELYAAGSRADQLIELASGQGVKDLYARMEFAEQDVSRSSGVFFGYTTHAWDYDPGDSDEVWVAPEGKAILLFTKIASEE
ncbi:MAG: DUF4062 domain-containing protein [Dehalococcoidia bacterium]|nr:DUF4062 domain-containing protein [Dehalococcoidia bacterium]